MPPNTIYIIYYNIHRVFYGELDSNGVITYNDNKYYCINDFLHKIQGQSVHTKLHNKSKVTALQNIIESTNIYFFEEHNENNCVYYNDVPQYIRDYGGQETLKHIYKLLNVS